MFSLLVSEIITQEHIDVGASALAEGLTMWPAMYDHWPGSKDQGHKITLCISSKNSIA